MSGTWSTKTFRLMDESRSSRSSAAVMNFETLNEISNDQENSDAADTVFKAFDNASSAQANSLERPLFPPLNDEFTSGKRSIADDNNCDLPNKRMRTTMSSNISVESDNLISAGMDLNLDINTTSVTDIIPEHEGNGKTLFDEIDAFDNDRVNQSQPASSLGVAYDADVLADGLGERPQPETLLPVNLLSYFTDDVSQAINEDSDNSFADLLSFGDTKRNVEPENSDVNLDGVSSSVSNSELRNSDAFDIESVMSEIRDLNRCDEGERHSKLKSPFDNRNQGIEVNSTNVNASLCGGEVSTDFTSNTEIMDNSSKCNVVSEGEDLPIDDLISQWSQFINATNDSDVTEPISVSADSRSGNLSGDQSAIDEMATLMSQNESELTYKSRNRDSCQPSLHGVSEKYTSSTVVMEEQQNYKQPSNSCLDKVDQEFNSMAEFLSHTGNNETALDDEDDETCEMPVKDIEDNADMMAPIVANNNINEVGVSSSDGLDCRKCPDWSHCTDDSNSAQHAVKSVTDSHLPPSGTNVIPQAGPINDSLTFAVDETDVTIQNILSSQDSSAELNIESFVKVGPRKDKSVTVSGKEHVGLLSSSASSDIFSSTTVATSIGPSSLANAQFKSSLGSSNVGSMGALEHAAFSNIDVMEHAAFSNTDVMEHAAFSNTDVMEPAASNTDVMEPAAFTNSDVMEPAASNTDVMEPVAFLNIDVMEPAAFTNSDVMEHAALSNTVSSTMDQRVISDSKRDLVNCEASNHTSVDFNGPDKKIENHRAEDATPGNRENCTDSYISGDKENEVNATTVRNKSSEKTEENEGCSGGAVILCDKEESLDSALEYDTESVDEFETKSLSPKPMNNDLLKGSFENLSPSKSIIIAIRSDASDDNTIPASKDVLASQDIPSVAISMKSSAVDVDGTRNKLQSIAADTLDPSGASSSINVPGRAYALVPSTRTVTLKQINLSNIGMNLSAVGIASLATSSVKIQGTESTSQLVRPVGLVENFNKVPEERAIVKLLSDIGSILATYCYVVGNARNTLEVLDGEPREAAIKKLSLIKSAAKPYICKPSKKCGCGFRDCLQNVIEWHRGHVFLNGQLYYQCCVCKSDRNLVVQFRSPAFLKFHMYDRHNRVLLLTPPQPGLFCPFCSFSERNFKLFSMHVSYCRKNFVPNRNLEPRASIWDFKVIVVDNKIAPTNKLLMPRLPSAIPGKVLLRPETSVSTCGIATSAVITNPLRVHRPILLSAALPIANSQAFPLYRPVTFVTSPIIGSSAQNLGNTPQQPYRLRPYCSIAPSVPVQPRPTTGVPRQVYRVSPAVTSTFQSTLSAPSGAAVARASLMSCPLCRISFSNVQQLMKHSETMHSQIWAAAQNILLQQGNPQISQVQNIAGAMVRPIIIQPIPEPSGSGLQILNGNVSSSLVSKIPASVNEFNKSPPKNTKKPLDSFLCWVCKRKCSGDQLQHMLAHGFTLWHMLVGFRCYMCLKMCCNSSDLETHVLACHQKIIRNADEMWRLIYKHVPLQCLVTMGLPEYSKHNNVQKCATCKLTFTALQLLRHGCIAHDWVPKMAKLDKRIAPRGPTWPPFLSSVSFKCCLCAKTFPLNADYVRHVRSTHLRPCKVTVNRLDKFTYAKYILKYAGLQVNDSDLLRLSIQSSDKSDLINGKSKERSSAVQPSTSRRSSNISSCGSNSNDVRPTGLVKSSEFRKFVSNRTAKIVGSVSVPSSGVKSASVMSANASRGARKIIASEKAVSTCAVMVIDDDTDEDDCVIVDSRPGKVAVKVSTSQCNISLPDRETSQTPNKTRVNVSSQVPHSNLAAQDKFTPQVSSSRSVSQVSPEPDARPERERAAETSEAQQVNKTSKAAKMSDEVLKSQETNALSNKEMRELTPLQKSADGIAVKKRKRPGPRCRTRRLSEESDASVLEILATSEALCEKTQRSGNHVVEHARTSSLAVVREVAKDLPESSVRKRKNSLAGSIIDDMLEKSPILGLLASCFVDLGDKVNEQTMKRRCSARMRSSDIDKSDSGSDLSRGDAEACSLRRRLRRKKSPLVETPSTDVRSRESRKRKVSPEPEQVLDNAAFDDDDVIVIKPSCSGDHVSS